MTSHPPPAAQDRPIQHLRITFWGTQGSLPISLPHHAGDTTCIEIETSEGNIILLDAGSGIRRCSLALVDRLAHQKNRNLHIFGSHEHLDHRIGLTFSRFCYVEKNPFNLHIYGSYQFLHALDQHYGLFSRQISDVTYLDDPVDYTMMSANFTATEIDPRGFRPPSAHPHRRAGDDPVRHWEVRDITSPIQIGRTTIQPFEVYHVIPCCLGYKIEHDGKTFLFATDHELRRGPDPNHPRQERSQHAESTLRALCKNVDLAYMDGQYFVDEYLGKKGIGSFPPMPRLDWGHSCIEDVIDRSLETQIKRTLIGHHDPERDFTARQKIDADLATLTTHKSTPIQLAHTDLVIEL